MNFAISFSEIRDAGEFVGKFNKCAYKSGIADDSASVGENGSFESDMSFDISASCSPCSSNSHPPSNDEIDNVSENTSTSSEQNRKLGKRKKKDVVSDIEVPNLTKQRKKEVIADPMKQGISDCKIGLYKVHISNMEVGTNRDLDEEFISFLLKKMEEFTDDSYQPYCAVIKNINKDEF
ncbi:uncharacterized protein LOC144358296 [Saccoglossus kowalevskii]